jgi:hypothetical protein
MVKRRVVMLMAIGTPIVAAATMARAAGQGPVPSSGACFYHDAEYRGRYVCVASGERLASLPDGLRNEVSSIRLFGEAEVKVYEHQNFDGRFEQFTADVPNLESRRWNDEVSAVEVWRKGSRSDPEVIVRRAYQDLLEREPDPPGMMQYRRSIVEDGWTEQQVRDDIRKSPEYKIKNTMTYPKAQEVVRRAYLAVLEREPDPGAKGFVDKVMYDKWTQQDVERELRKSDEYRNRPR